MQKGSKVWCKTMSSDTLWERVAPIAVMTIFVMIVQILSLALMPSLFASEVRVFENPESAANPLGYILLVLGFTLFVLVAIKKGKGWIVSGTILLAVVMSIYYVLYAFFAPSIALILSVVVLLLLCLYPEWYVIDLVGLLVCAGVSTLFGLSMTVFPTLLLLMILAIYDGISVYKTKHMVTLAEGVMNIRAPLLFIVPRRRSYSFRKEGTGGNDRGAYFLGLGDAIIPTVLVISANWSLNAPLYGVGGLMVNVPALGAMLGTYLGFVALSMTPREKPQAGLPFLNGGAVLGFIVGSLMAGVSIF